METWFERSWLYILMGVMLASGTVNTIVAKFQDSMSSDGKTFNHPYFQTASMFVGELMCLLFFYFMKLVSKKPEDQLLPPDSKPPVKKKGCVGYLGPFIFALPAVFDLSASTLMMVGLGLTAASVYQMMRGLIVVVVALYSVVFLRRTLFRHQVLGVVFVLVGVFIVGLASILKSQSSSRNPILGAILIVAAQFLAGGVFVVEEKFFGDVKVPALQAVGIEGLCGLTYFCILLPIFYGIPCYDEDLCSGDGHVEDFTFAFKQLPGNGLLFFLFFAYIFSISFFNWSGISVTKKASSLARSTIDTSRTLFVWIIDLAARTETFDYLQLIGFLILVVGTLMYNEVLVFPYWGFKESVENNREYMRRLKEKQAAKLNGEVKEDEITAAEEMKPAKDAPN